MKERQLKNLGDKEHKGGRGGSKKKNGGRANDVKPETLSKRVREHPGHHLKRQGGEWPHSPMLHVFVSPHGRSWHNTLAQGGPKHPPASCWDGVGPHGLVVRKHST